MNERVDLEALEYAVTCVIELGPRLEADLLQAIAELRRLRGMEADREWRDGQERPVDGAHVAYLFEPFGTYHVGRYDATSDSVHGKSGFTTWRPEVKAWFLLPPPIQEAQK